MTVGTVKDEQHHVRMADWLQRIRALLDGIEAWSVEQNWSTHRAEKTIHEQQFGTYSAPILRVRAPAGEIHVTPIALQVVGAEGRVDLEAWPSLNRVKLVGRGGAWE